MHDPDATPQHKKEKEERSHADTDQPDAPAVGAGPASSAPAPPRSWRSRPSLPPAGAATTVEPAIGAHRERRCAERLEHGGAERRAPARPRSSWTSTTQFSKTVTEAVSALAVGDCVTVTGTPSKKSKTTIAARSITVTHAVVERVVHRAFGAAAPAARRVDGPGAGGFQFRGGGGRRRVRRAAEGGTRPSFPGGGSGRQQLPQGAGQPRHRERQGHRRQRIDGDGVGDDLSPGSFADGQRSKNSQDQEAHDAQDGEPSRSRPRARRRSARPRRPRRPTWRSVTA